MLVILCLAAVAAEEPFQVTLKRDTDRVTITSAKDQTTFAIQSPFGISEATIERRQETWPARVKLRLQLKGLENFQVSNGAIRVWKKGREDSPLRADDPHRPEIQRRDDALEITLPKAFFERNPKSLTLRWIDFYR